MSLVSRLSRLLQGPGRAQTVPTLYAWIVAQARHPDLFVGEEGDGIATGQVPDTPTGRLECLVAHVAILFRALRQQEGAAGAALNQRVFDHMVEDLEHNLTELGAGDSNLSKRMNKLQAVITGRLRAIETALDAPDDRAEALAAVLARTVIGADWTEEDAATLPVEAGRPLAAVLLRLLTTLEEGGTAALMAGRLPQMPEPTAP